MPGEDTRKMFDRYVGVAEAAPIAFGQILYRSVLKRSDKGKKSPSYQADLTAWMRQAQRGECDPEEAWEIFSLSAAHWVLLSGIGIVAAICLDFICGDLSVAVVVFSLSVPPAFSLLSFADAVRARVMRDAEVERKEKRKRLGKKKQETRLYRPIGSRRIIPLAVSVLLLPVWIVVFVVG
ncbi:hypothetical protein ACFVAM_24010 [Streptomyces californicus]|uniref:hypothetical protein n=1 Tax=Streptomyces californicus TaxID=67351 RepID=UPI0036A844B3